MADYNGWTNYETWLVNLWLGEDFRIYAEEQPDSFACDQYKLSQALKDYTEETVQMDTGSVEGGLTVDLLNAALSAVNWYEIAGHYVRAEAEEDA
jgi:hypothetical protein